MPKNYRKKIVLQTISNTNYLVNLGNGNLLVMLSPTFTHETARTMDVKAGYLPFTVVWRNFPL